MNLYMTLLILGVAVFWAAHLFKRVAPRQRAAMGERGKGLVAGLLVFSVIVMVIGYRGAGVVPVYAPMAGMGHLNNALMLVSVFLYSVGGTKGTLYTRMRHPMLWGTAIWAGAHLLVNGDAASLVLFGGIGVWALVEMAVINRAGPWLRPVGGRGIKGDAMGLAGTVVLYGVIVLVHQWLGYPVFSGNYG